MQNRGTLLILALFANGCALGIQGDPPGSLAKEVVNQSPTAVADTATTIELRPVTISPLSNDTDPEEATLSISAVATPANGSAVISGTTIVYTPNAGFQGADSISYTVSDGEKTATGTISVTVSDYCSAFTQTTAAPFTSDFTPTPDGSADNPYLICNTAQLDHVADPANSATLWDKTYNILEDLDLGAGYTASRTIGTLATSFTGSVNGSNHTLSNFTINEGATDYIGLFGHITGGTISNLRMASATVTGQDFTGAMIGHQSGATISNLQITSGTVTGRGSVGGLIGRSVSNSTVASSSSAANVDGTNDRVGGLIGDNDATPVSSSSASGTITDSANPNDVGGLIGRNASGSNITDSFYETGQIDCFIGDNHGGLIGYNIASTITNSRSTGAHVRGRNNLGGLVGRNQAASNIVDSHATTNVIFDNTGGRGGGLVGDNADSTITNSYGTGTVQGTAGTINHGGGLVGYNVNSAISSSYATGTVGGLRPGSFRGGLVGYNQNSPVSNSYSETGNVSGGGHIGGLIGHNLAGSTITNCYSTRSTLNQNDYAGGLIAQNADSAVTDSYATGSLSPNFAASDYLGGLIGHNTNSNLLRVYSTNSMGGTNGSWRGALVGFNTGSTVTDSYSTGGVFGSSSVAGLIGNNNAGSNILRCYSTAAVDIQGSGSGGLVGDNDASTITDSNFKGTVNHSFGTISNVGLLVGDNTNGSHIQGSFVDGTFTFSGGTPSGPWGGLVGNNNASTITDSYVLTRQLSLTGNSGGLVGSNTNSNILRSFSRATVHSAGSNVGGLIGLNSGSTVTDSYALGNVFSTFGSQNGLGGLIGNNSASSHVTDSYSMGSVQGGSGGSNRGGLIGINDASNITRCAAYGFQVWGSGGLGGLIGSNANGSLILRSFSHMRTETGGTTSGGLVGLNDGSEIRESFATGTINRSFNASGGQGGLVGQNQGASPINRSFATGNVTGQGHLKGGLVGDNLGSSPITDSYSTGSVSGHDTLGGLIGRNAGSSNVTRSFATGLVQNVATDGGLVGNDDASNTYTNTFWDDTVNAAVGTGLGNQADPAGVIGDSTSDLRLKATFIAQNFDWEGESGVGTLDYWTMKNGADATDYPRLTWYYQCYGGNLTDSPYANSAATPAGTAADPIYICSPAQLNAIGANSGDWSKYFILSEDVDLTAITWNGIGSSETPFRGTFDGRKYTIDNFTHDGGADAGLFDYVQGSSSTIWGTTVDSGRIFQTRVSNINVDGTDNVGGIVGNLDRGRVFDSRVLSGTIDGTNQVGGLVGRVGPEVRNATSNVLTNWGGSLRLGVVSAGVVTTGTGTATGGAVGENAGRTVQAAALGNTAGAARVGGTVGFNSGWTQESYAKTGVVTGTSNVGGLCGENTGTLFHTYSAGTIPGLVFASSGTVTDSFFDDDNETAPSAAGTGLTGAARYNSANYTNWDFTNTWAINAGVDFPYLRQE